MHHQVAVGFGEGVADLEHQADALAGREPPAVAVGVDGLAFHVLHREVGQAVGGAGVEDAGEVGVVEAGEDSAFGLEAAQLLVADLLAAQELEGCAALELGVVRQGEDPHAAFTQQALDAVGAHLLPGSQRRGGLRRVGGRLPRRLPRLPGEERSAEDAAFGVLEAQQLLDLAAQAAG